MIAELAPLISAVVNSSLDQVIFPSTLKEAVLRPLLKKINLDPIKKNYRLVSNLAFLCKLIEKFASKKIINISPGMTLWRKCGQPTDKKPSTKSAVLKSQV